ncbi:MAG TPA: hypothetical protein VGQ99_05970 [Tepidisphaeraceae bacterium]|nr:hypothetical protein [Tepidisphaeraceae bacterium]
MISPNPTIPPSFWRELADGSAGPVTRLMVNLCVGVALAGMCALLSYFLAGMVPDWGRNPTRGIYPTDELVGGLAVIASGAFIAFTAWLWSRKRRWRAIVAPTILTIAIAVATIIVCLLVENNLRGDRDIVLFGVIMLGGSGVILVWVEVWLGMVGWGSGGGARADYAAEAVSRSIHFLTRERNSGIEKRAFMTVATAPRAAISSAWRSVMEAETMMIGIVAVSGWEWRMPKKCSPRMAGMTRSSRMSCGRQRETRLRACWAVEAATA